MRPRVENLLGKTLKKVEVNNVKGRLKFEADDGYIFSMWNCLDPYNQSGHPEDVVGNLEDLVGTPILEAEEVSCQTGRPKGTWKLYKISTAKGSVIIRVSSYYIASALTEDQCAGTVFNGKAPTSEEAKAFIKIEPWMKYFMICHHQSKTMMASGTLTDNRINWAAGESGIPWINPG